MTDSIFAELLIPGDILSRKNGTIVLENKITDKIVTIKTDDSGTLKFPRKKKIKIYNAD